MAKEIKLILSDIDGTILDNNHQVDAHLRDTITELKKESIPFVLASARSPHGMFPIAQELNLGANPIACYNGALIVEGNKEHYQTLIEHGLSKADVKKIVALIKKQFPHISINFYSGGDWIVEEIDQWVQIEADITKESPDIRNFDTLLTDDSIPIHKLLLIANAQAIQEFFTYLKRVNFEDASFYLSKDNYLEVTSQSVSKENALLEIAKYYDISLSQTMAIGDNYNDIPMLKLAGLGVAMANAPQAVKNEADIETVSNNDNGVSKVIEDYVLI
ncbi:fructose-phosphate phosphohydrolase SppA [Streptococcus mutans]|uniref:fructose-phosphate phosphohydrolase SppA n=1 Tax=Streptococcus mutans TaxID=1309 RepID=UPI000464264C|nr:fructose-phosphate phosphohydrolase SppA [Streptococcus mutans]AVM71980.1 Cof-type HAD-IIB family hydrolase [Streptococcus mutans]MCB4933808.1 fructose-phosphate phosphohydrolase SppA [Streptococcus mutans]MCB4989108.1 fructose-phosphate phosphohydrolase SppA [Streptococcus mutans]MCB5012329.1 fructose-phosphate phosphohydrolase SppA [Streptococcus mutans]MCB5022626.1 fructose-phosphate phosphohydrolase SppA [Streptococcus mutans]